MWTRGPTRKTFCGARACRAAATRRRSSGPTACSSRRPTATDGFRARLSAARTASCSGRRSGRRPHARVPRTRKTARRRRRPATDGARVYASFGSKGLLAVDFEGRVVWHRSLGAFSTYHGTAGSPLLYKDRLILFQDHAAAAASSRRSTRDRPPFWRTRAAERSDGARRSPSRRAITTRSSSAASAACMRTTPTPVAMLWTARGNTYEVIPTPVVGHGLVFCSSGRAGPTLAIRPGGKGDVTNTHVAWQSPRGSPFVPSPLLLRRLSLSRERHDEHRDVASRRRRGR